MRTIRLEVEHATSGDRRVCEFVENLAQRERRQLRAKALVLRWPLGGQMVFCIASGWELEWERWRLTADSRARARKLAKDEGLELPEPAGFPPRANARARAEPSKPVPVDPRQARLPF